MALHINYVLDPVPRARTRVYNPHAHLVTSPLSCTKLMSMCCSADRRRRLTRKRVQRHRGRTDEARRETARVADRKILGRQNEVDVRRSQRLAITHAGYVLKLYQSFPRSISAWLTTYALACKEDFLYTYSTQESKLLPPLAAMNTFLSSHSHLHWQYGK